MSTKLTIWAIKTRQFKNLMGRRIEVDFVANFGANNTPVYTS